jgi:hypothetical protein
MIQEAATVEETITEAQLKMIDTLATQELTETQTALSTGKKRFAVFKTKLPNSTLN